MKTFTLGQKVCQAGVENYEYLLKCPDCFGTWVLSVLLGDQTVLKIACVTCASGYEPPRGVVRVWQYRPTAEVVTINRIEMGTDGIIYGTTKGYHVTLEDLFENMGDAQTRADEKVRELGALEMEKFYKKEKPARDWASNVRYHRSCLKEAQREVQHHESKLNVAQSHVKEEKA